MITSRASGEKISLSIIAFSLIVFFMLFDTRTYHLGRITAFVSSSLFIVASTIESHYGWIKYSIKVQSLAVFAFIALSLSSILINQIEAYLPSIAAVALLSSVAIIVSSRSYSVKETEYLANIIIIATLIYTIWFLLTADYYYYSTVRKTLFILGSAIDPNIFGSSLICGALLLLDRFIRFKNNKVAFLVSLLLVIYAIILTASRTAYITAVLVFSLRILYALKGKKTLEKRLLLIVVIVLFVIILGYAAYRIAPNNISRMLAIDTGDGGNGRIELWVRALKNWIENPLFGIGYGASFNPQAPISDTNMVTHNTLLKLLSETGLIGLGLFIIFFISLFPFGYRMSALAKLVLLSVIVPSFLLDMLDNKVLWVVICYSIIIAKTKRTNNYNQQLS